MRIKAGKLKKIIKEALALNEELGEKLYGDLPFENQDSNKAVNNDLDSLVKSFAEYNKKNPSMKLVQKWDQNGAAQKLGLTIDELWKRNVDLAATDLMTSVKNSVGLIHERMMGDYYLAQVESEINKINTPSGKFDRPPEAKDGVNYNNTQHS
jgi:hypothetical protein